MKAKSKTMSRAKGPVRRKSKKSPTVALKRSAKAKVRAGTLDLPSIKTRTSLVGIKIYPASIEPSDRMKLILKDLTIKSSAA